MGTGSSKNPDSSSHGSEEREENLDHSGGQLYVSLKMENYKLKGDLVPHVYGSVPLIGSWDSSKSLSMERESTLMWELSFVIPPNHETLDFKFLLKPKYSNAPCIVEEGPNRVLTRGTLQGDSRMALFRFNSDEVLEYRVLIKADRVSPFDLAASWRASQENLQPSTVRGIPDVSINAAPEAGTENGSVASLELDLEHYVVPAPATCANSGLVYAANMTETPRSLIHAGTFSKTDGSSSASHSTKVDGASVDRPAIMKGFLQFDQIRLQWLELHLNCQEMEVLVPDPSKVYSASGMVELKSVGTFSPLQKQDGHRGLFVDRGVGSPRLVKSASASAFTTDLKLDSKTKNAMPAAAGAVAAAAVADQMLGPKEDRHLAIVLVGLPARGKTFTAAKLTRYLRWLGHGTKHFNVGKYRRIKHGANLAADFFRDDNPEGIEARNEVAALAMDDMISWMQEGGQVGIFDATNSTRKRRNMLMKMAEGKCKIIFLETICNDGSIIERNIRLKIQQSPDYAEEPDFEAGLQDFKTRLTNYEKVYETVEEGSYIKMIDMVKGHGGQIQISLLHLAYIIENGVMFQVNNISGYLPGRIVFFLVNTHLTPRPIFLTRHGESRDNVRGRIGGDTVLSESGELYSKKLANFVEKRLKAERAASIWTSTLQRTILTASPIVGLPKIQWRALDEINAGVCDGMTYEEIKKNMPEEYESRKKDKLRYRYPRGESYLDVIQRLEPVIIELERQRAPVVVISHQAVLRALYAYFADRPLNEIPHIEPPTWSRLENRISGFVRQQKTTAILHRTGASMFCRCLHDQRLLLLQLKKSLSFNYSTSLKLVSWNSTPDCCTWNGVICDEAAAYVTGLDISSEGITGGINSSSSLFNLGYLQSLNLANNSLGYTQIPSGFGRLSNLTHLNLSNSGFSGQVPIEISHLSRLVSLDLSIFPFHVPLKLEDPDLRALVRNLSRLRELRLDGVNISAPGSEWCQTLSSALPNLQVLSLSNCYLWGPLDSTLLNLHSLSEIHLNQNNISAEVPASFANFSNLTTLHLSSCELSGKFPEKIFQIRALRTLDISNNPSLLGSLPEFPPDGSLQTLELSHTNFSETLPDSIGNLRFLSKLQLAHCDFNGSIPSSIGNLTQLLILDMSYNKFIGKIPSFDSFKNLTQINLAHNRLGGVIPPSLFSLTSLQKLQLAHNQLTGQLGEFFNVSSSLLDTLDLTGNKLQGPIPVSFFELRSLKILALSSNNFSGTVQLNMIQKLGNLSNLDLSYNRLSITSDGNSTSSSFPKIDTLKLASCKLSVFPDFLKTQSQLSHLDLSDNQIHGLIPNWIWKIGNLTLRHLNLSHNMLDDVERPLPDFSSSQLAVLDLHKNMLQGPILILPPFATVLDYSSNNFSSTIPANITEYLAFAIFFSLSSNKLTGQIPPLICHAGFLQVLDLSSNNLSGEIPACLDNLGRTLRVLNLRQNNFHGTIPPQVFPGGCVLRTLDLNGNRLEGRVPRTLANCTMLEVLDLGNNQINDTFPSWLRNLTHLRVLVLRSNKFHGTIGCPGPADTFRMLQIIDLSSNEFTGNLPPECFLRWNGMMISEDESESKQKHTILKFGFLELSQLYYQDAVTVTSKGLQMELVKILTVFFSIDLSNNRFQGEIPEEIGRLKSLYVLNLSHNAFAGQIPSSLGNLAQLESLDLSQNKLNGEIPMQLANLTFLSVLNLSDNRLVGMIPKGPQFQTFREDSFDKNTALCGFPLTIKCTDAKVPPSLTPTSKDSGSKSCNEFDWQLILTGLGFGGGVGIVLGPLMFWKRGRKWYDEHIDRVLFMVLPLAGLHFTNFDDGKVEAEESMGEELREIRRDHDDEEEEEEEDRRGRFCVLCSMLDISRKRVGERLYRVGNWTECEAYRAVGFGGGGVSRRAVKGNRQAADGGRVEAEGRSRWWWGCGSSKGSGAGGELAIATNPSGVEEEEGEEEEDREEDDYEEESMAVYLEILVVQFRVVPVKGLRALRGHRELVATPVLAVAPVASGGVCGSEIRR
ncbi:hypothetical protein HHK36_016162 [Tetracentron sinense]|uniref:CBM20 domain-containing protein n=4 Tax=Magnoliopsida TaxID=3398 RepID=A0A834Z588_TETSI|nr:hypothetical protein HHK36_016162 [Tetracentron sinense]